MTRAELALFNVDPAWALFAVGLRSNLRFDITGTLMVRSLLAVRDQIEARRDRAAKYGGHELLHALNDCLRENVPVPAWLNLELRQRLDRFFDAAQPTLTLDEALSVPGTKKRRAAAAQDWVIGAEIFMEMRRRSTEFSSFDEALSAVLLTRDWGVGKTKARSAVKRVEQVYLDLQPTYRPFSRIWRKPRKVVTGPEQ